MSRTLKLAVGVHLAALALPGAHAWALDLRVIVPNLKSTGRVAVAVYDDIGAWSGDGKPLATAVVPVEGGRADVTFRGLKPGQYAVTAFQDRNGDGRLGRLPFGWATEPVGYTNGARALFGRPKWDDADFVITDDQRTTVFVRLRDGLRQAF